LKKGFSEIKAPTGAIIGELNEEELLILRREVKSRRKSVITAWLLWLFLGIFAAHRFYLGHFRSGIVMLSLDLFIIVGFILSLAFHIINAAFGIAIGFAILTILGWFVVDIFMLPFMLRKDRLIVQGEVLAEITARRASPPSAS